jgi:hypothetical protein
MPRKILSISAANGWWAGYGDEKQQNFNRVVCFALCEDSDGQSIEAVDTSDFEQFGTTVASDSDGFRGLFHESEFEVIGEKLQSGHFASFLRGTR